MNEMKIQKSNKNEQSLSHAEIQDGNNEYDEFPNDSHKESQEEDELTPEEKEHEAKKEDPPPKKSK
jgi:hypothetical protein